MEMKLSDETAKIISEASRKLNIGINEIISLAITSYLEDRELKEEFKAWERLSDEALEKFEKNL